MIELGSVSICRGGTLPLDRVSLTLGAEVAVLIGPSGSGKTTLLRVALGLDAPDSGEVKINGAVASREGRVLIPPEARNIAMVFQDLALWPHLSVYGNLDFGLRARRVDAAERRRRIEEALAWVGLENKQKRRPDELSGGERQRVAVARALVLNPGAILLDEPLGSLDVALKEELCELFVRLFQERRTPALYVTHDAREALRLAQRIILLEGGRIAQDCPPERFIEAPATPFAAAFVRAARGEWAGTLARRQGENHDE